VNGRAPADHDRATSCAPDRTTLARWAGPLLLLITLLVMGGVCFNQFVGWDDDSTIRQNPALLPPTIASLWQFWTTQSKSLYVPLTYTVWALISWATQFIARSGQLTQAPWAFHAANLAIHLIAVLSVFRILCLLNLSRLGCFCGALLFAIHPIQVEAIAWASGLKDVLSGALCVFALRQYLLYAKQTKPALARMHYLQSVIAFLAALLAKPGAMTLPLCAAAADRFAVGRSWRRAISAAGPWLVVAIPVSLFARILQENSGTPSVPLWTRPFIAADSLTFYIGKIIWPIHLSVDYGHTPTAVLASGRCYWDWLVPAAIAIALIAGRRRRPLLLLAGVLFVCGCLPVLGLVTSSFSFISVTADHYLYFAMLGPAVVLAWLLTTYTSPPLRWLTILALLFCCILSIRQVGFWKDDDTLWPHTLAVNPNSFVALTHVGMAYANAGEYPLAIDAFGRAAELRPKDDIAPDDLANALHQAGRLDDAIIAKRRTVEIERDVPYMHANWERNTAELGAFLCEDGRYGEALPYLQSAHAIAPHDARVAALLQRATMRVTTAP
jgi:hypothetical protein